MYAILWSLTAHAEDWRDLPWLSADPAALLAAASQSQSPGDLDVLIVDVVLHIGADGRREERRRTVYEVNTHDGAERYGAFGADWSPWFQDRPELAARVITPDGVAHALRTEDIAEGIDRGDDAVMSDVHSLRAPLPALAPGSVVEQTTVVREHRPFMKDGAVALLTLDGGYPGAHIRYRVEVEDGAAFSWQVDSSPLVAVEGHSKGLRTLTMAYDVPPEEQPAPDDANKKDDDPTGIHELGKPPDVRAPQLVVSTARSWQALASAYGRVIDERLTDANLDEVAKAARGDATTPRQVAARLLTYVQRIRYVGIEFGQGAIVPATPAEVAQRGYGDCKDKATLLVGLLRASGIDAQVALLQTGPGDDVPPLPGLDLFNHAIVHVSGKDELWIDPTSDFAEVGDLPWQDQGRLALIASPSTKALRKTPVTPAAENGVHIVRTITLAPRGPATVAVTQTFTGWPEHYARARFDGGDPATLAERLKYDATEIYSGTVASDPRVGNTRDLAAPFAFTYRVDKARYGYTADGEAAARFNVWDEVLDRMPEWLLSTPADDAFPRKHDYVYAAYHAESEQIIVPPPDFVAAVLPDPMTLVAGPVSLSTRYEVREDGAVVAHAVFDSGPGHLTPEQIALVQSTFDVLSHTPFPMVTFQDTGAIAFREQRIGDALAIYRARWTAAPHDVGALDGWAWALTQAGFADEARPIIAEAARLAPDDRTVRMREAYIALCDSDGRIGKRPGDRPTARAALEAAIALDPKDRVAYLLLAGVDEIGDDGSTFGPGTEPARTIDALVRFRKELDAHDMDATLVGYYMRLDRWDDVAKFVGEMDAGEARNFAKVALAAMRGGADAGIVEASHIADLAARRVALNSAGDELLRHRRYVDAGRLLDAAAPGTPNPMAARDRARLIGKVVRHEELVLAPDDPAAAARRIVIASAKGDSAALAGLIAKDLLADADGDAKKAVPGSFKLTRLPALSVDALIDLTLGSFESTVEGAADTGWRVRLTNPTSGQSLGTAFIVREKGVCKLRAFSSDFAPLGTEAMRRAGAGDVKGARLWLSWAHDLDAKPQADPFLGTTLSHVWRETDDKHMLHVLAALVAATDKTAAEEVLAVFDREDASITDAALRLQVDRARLIALLVLKRPNDAVPVMKRMLAAHPDSLAARELDVWLSMQLRDYAGAQKAARGLFEANPTDPSAIRTYGDASQAAEDVDEMLRAYHALFALGVADAGTYNNVAWRVVFDPRHLAEGLDLATQANQAGGWKVPSALHTLAVALVESGRTGEAHDVLLKSIDLPGADAPGQVEAWMYLRGRLADAWSLPDIARTYYARIGAPEADEGTWTVRSLTARQLASPAGPQP